MVGEIFEAGGHLVAPFGEGFFGHLCGLGVPC